jgi:hypothetical protein
MALFTRKSNQPPVPPAGRPALSGDDLGNARRLMDRWDASLGTSDAVWDTIEEIARLGGFRGTAATLDEVASGGSPDEIRCRPWRWWAEASRSASASGDDVLAGRIFLFCALFMTQVLPDMTARDMVTTGLGDPGTAIHQSLARNAVDALSRLPGDLVIHDTATGTVDVANALRLAQEVLDGAG